MSHHSECLICESNIWHLFSVCLLGMQNAVLCSYLSQIPRFYIFVITDHGVVYGGSMVGGRKSILGLDCLRLTPPSTSCTTCTAVSVMTVLCPVHGLSPLTSYVIAHNPYHCYCFGPLGAGGCDHDHDALAVTCCGGVDYWSLMLQPQIRAVSAGFRCMRSLRINAAMCYVQLKQSFNCFALEYCHSLWRGKTKLLYLMEMVLMANPSLWWHFNFKNTVWWEVDSSGGSTWI
jgi:hypothetical protein